MKVHHVTKMPAIRHCPEPDDLNQHLSVIFFTTLLNIILPLLLALPSERPTKAAPCTPPTHFLHQTPAADPVHLILLQLTNLATFGEHHKSHSSSLRSFVTRRLLSSLLDPNIFLHTLLSKILSSPFPKETDQIAQPQATRRKVDSV